MPRFQDIPIKRKLTLVILLIATVAVLAATAALFVSQLVTFRRTFVRDTTALSGVIANQCKFPLEFNVAKDARDILGALQDKLGVVSAVVEKDGRPFAQVGPAQAAWPAGLTNGYAFEGGYLLCAVPILGTTGPVGALYLRAEYGKAFNSILRGHLNVFLAVLIASILLTLVLSSRLQRIISDPILRLADTAQTVAAKKDYSARAVKISNDELGLFTDAFNQMLSQIQVQDTALKKAHDDLEDRVQALQHEIGEREHAERRLEVAHRELVEASRRSGMAEVATGVLHNVGNVLNSVNVSAILLQDTIRKSEVATVKKLAEVLHQHADDLGTFLAQDPRGKQVPRLVEILAGQLAEERSQMERELELLAKNIAHIKNIVALQQDYASAAGFVEPVALDKLVEDALQINAAALIRHGVEVVRRFENAPRLLIDKHKVLQILVNLIQNAKYALQETGRPVKRLTIGIQKAGDTAARIVIEDNGVGIPAENLTRIFSHGFTTREKGHGFGLHASALAAKEMGGELRAQSTGWGGGATFILELPLTGKEPKT